MQTKFSELIKLASKNLTWKYDAGAGLQLYGDISQEAKNHVEYVLKPTNCTLFTLKTPRNQWENKGMAAWVGTLGYERWVQFAPAGWEEMQKANAAVMTHSVKVLPEIARKIQDILNDDAKYPQLKLHDNTRERLEKILEEIEKVN